MSFAHLLHCEPVSSAVSGHDNPMYPSSRQSESRFAGLLHQRGFTLVELVMVIVIVGILAAVAAPRFFDANVFQSRGFADQVQAALRYAQKVAVAQRRFVCVAFTANSVTLTSGSTAACGTPLPAPTGEASYVAPSGITFTAVPASFNFNALGSPSFAAARTINIAGASKGVTIEAETGYVH